MKNKSLLPKLRFPEFRDAGEWETVKLKQLTNLITKGTTPTSLGYEFTTSGINFIKIESITEEGIIDISKVATISEECHEALKRSQLKVNDILFSIAGALGVVSIVNDDILPANTNQALAIIRLDNKESLEFISNFLKTQNIQSEVIKIKAGAAQPNISLAQLGDFDIFLPSPAEQQKIADCLSALDGLIAAQSEKVAALQTYKKGLMQNLFPAEGESVPRLRFEEFKSAGEWEVKEFQELIDVIDGDRGANYPKSEEFYESGYCVFLNAKNVTKNGFAFDEIQFITQEKDETLRKGKLRRSDIVLTTRGSVGNFAFYSPTVPYENIRINSGMVILRIKSQLIDDNYLYIYNNSEIISRTIERIAFGSAQPQLTVSEIKKFKLHYPKLPEQQRIAGLLSALDEEIHAQGEVLAGLRAHKRGLMQQLFPQETSEVLKTSEV